MKTIILILLTVVSVNAQVLSAAGSKKEIAKAAAESAKDKPFKLSDGGKIIHPMSTQEHTKELREEMEELAAVSKLIKRNQDIKIIIDNRIILLSTEYQNVFKAIYGSRGIDINMVQRDSIGGETLYFELKSTDSPHSNDYIIQGTNK